MLRAAELQHHLLIRSKLCSILDSEDQFRTSPIWFQTKRGCADAALRRRSTRVLLAIEMHVGLLGG
jgi:hypothetical protein